MKNMYEKNGHIPVDSWWHAGLDLWSVWLFKGTKLQREVRPKLPRSTTLSCHSFGDGAWQTLFSTLISCDDDSPQKSGECKDFCVFQPIEGIKFDKQIQKTYCVQITLMIIYLLFTSIVMIKGRLTHQIVQTLSRGRMIRALVGIEATCPVNRTLERGVMCVL